MSIKAIILSIITGVSIVSCGATVRIIDANEQLNSFYHSLAQAQATGDETMEVTALSMLEDLAKSSAEQADKTINTLNKISFYRVAATAAWKAGDTNVISYSNAGQAVCKKEWANAPRDCGMLTFIKYLAAVDETTKLFAIEQPKPNHQIDDDQARLIFDNYESAALGMISESQQLQSSVPASLVSEFNNRLNDLVCTNIRIGANGLATRASIDVNASCRIDNLRTLAGTASIPLPGCIGPITNC
jgi:hypothetical protein